jgi:hypothetical protein
MKATLEFNLPEEQQEHYEAINGGQFRYCLQELDEYLRDWMKHGHSLKSADEALECVRKNLNDLLHDNDLILR